MGDADAGGYTNRKNGMIAAYHTEDVQREIKN